MTRTPETRIVHETPWIRLREDRLRLLDGSEHTYTYIERPRYAIVAAVEDMRIWFVEQYRHPLRRRSLELPMGIAPGGDAITPEEHARIELREETGVTAERLMRVGEIAAAPGLLAQTGVVFLATGLSHGETSLEATEQDMTSRAIPVGEAVAMAVDGRIICGQTIAALGLLRMRELI